MKNFSNYTDYDKKDNLHFESKAVHGALGTEPLTGAVSMPIFQAVTYRHPALGESTGFAYSRLENPTRQELERTMAILEGGIKAFAFSSGQAANMAVFSLLNPGDHVLLSDDIYGGTFRIIGDVFGKYGIDIRREPILVYPTLHYQNGGVEISGDCMSKVENLFVAGEASGGVHGRNRLMGNSLLDVIVFGRNAGKFASEKSKSVEAHSRAYRKVLEGTQRRGYRNIGTVSEAPSHIYPRQPEHRKSSFLSIL